MRHMLLPAGALRSDIGIQQDYRGQPREVFAQHGVVAADHGRCSDIGAHARRFCNISEKKTCHNIELSLIEQAMCRSTSKAHRVMSGPDVHRMAAGLKVLVEGGNAVDAAVATALCQGIMNPMASGCGIPLLAQPLWSRPGIAAQAGNRKLMWPPHYCRRIGGGGFMVIRTAQGETKVIDAREVAPLGATEGMFIGAAPSSSFPKWSCKTDAEWEQCAQAVCAALADTQTCTNKAV